METKICTKCGIEKDVIEFHKHKGGLFNRQGKCKICVKEINSLPENRAKAVQRTLKWAENNPEKVVILRKAHQNKIRGTDKYRKYYRDLQHKKYHEKPEWRLYMRDAAKKYEQSKKGKIKRKEISQRWHNGLSDEEREAYNKRQSLFARTTLNMQIKTLHDSYISKLLVGYVDKTIPKEIIEAKRLIVKINRALVKRGICVR